MGQGTSFHLHLPLSEATSAPTLEETPLVRGHGRVLVVDDEPLVRTTAQAILEQLGYEVLVAEDGARAVELYEAERPDLVVLDMIMPIMNGRQAFERLKELDPEVRVLLSSGFAKSEDVASMRAQGLKGFVTKPYAMRGLAEAVAAALELEPTA